MQKSSRLVQTKVTRWAVWLGLLLSPQVPVGQYFPVIFIALRWYRLALIEREHAIRHSGYEGAPGYDNQELEAMFGLPNFDTQHLALWRTMKRSEGRFKAFRARLAIAILHVTITDPKVLLIAFVSFFLGLALASAHAIAIVFGWVRPLFAQMGGFLNFLALLPSALGV